MWTHKTHSTHSAFTSQWRVIVCLLYFAMASVESRTGLIKRKTFEGDIMMGKKEMKSLQNEILFTGKVHPVHTWHDATVPYTMDPEFEKVAEQRDMILEAMKEISGQTCIKFIQRRKDDKDYIAYVKHDNKCSSRVGRVGGKQDILMSPSTCMRPGTVIHELLHALGLYHEQSREDRDKFITIVWNNLKSSQSKVNFEKYGTKLLQQYPGLPYDYASILHYSPEAFSKKSGQKTILTKTENAPIGQRVSMSHFDKVKIDLLYQCPIEED